MVCRLCLSPSCIIRCSISLICLVFVQVLWPGSLCPVELMKQVEEKMYMKVTSVYGLTETAPGMTATRIDDSFDVRCNTVGRDFEFTEVRGD